MGSRSVCGGQSLERPNVERRDDKWTKCRKEKFQLTNYRKKKVLNGQKAERNKRLTQSSHTIDNYILLYLQFPQK